MTSQNKPISEILVTKATLHFPEKKISKIFKNKILIDFSNEDILCERLNRTLI